MTTLQKAKRFFNDLPNKTCSGSGASGEQHPPAVRPRIKKMSTEDIAAKIFAFLREDLGELLDSFTLMDIECLLDRFPRSMNLLDLMDPGGWNLLQKAVISDQPDVVEILLARGCDPNSGTCSPPLHLASKMGYARIVQILLDHGARADISRGVCHPVPHYLKRTGEGKPPKFRCRRIRVPCTPLGFAIPYDRSEVVQILLTHRNSKDVVKKDMILHEACKYRARNCVRLLVQFFPEKVNLRDKRNFTPLHYSLRGPKDRECAIALLESEAVFSPTTFKTNYGTLLHELYVSDDTTHFLKLTELMLKKAPPDFTQEVTSNGDTLLHKLLKYFGGANQKSLDDQYGEEVAGCVKLLLEHDCDPNSTNKCGESSLHALLSHHGGRPLFYIRDRFRVGPTYMGFVIRNVSILMEQLLKHGADANLMVPPNFVTPLFYLMRVVCAMSPSLLRACGEEVKTCAEILCRNDANPNQINILGDNTMTLLLSSLNRWLYHNNSDEARPGDALLRFTGEAVKLFIKHGMNPQTVLRKNLKQLVIIFNVNVRDPSLVGQLNYIIKSVVCSGGNPNIINFNDQNEAADPRHTGKYSILYYLARGFYIHCRNHNETAFEILNIFLNTLSQRRLCYLVEGICQHMDKEFTQNSAPIKIKVKSFVDSPRSLKRLSRITIFQALNWKVEDNITNIPFPMYLTDFLMDIDYIKEK